MKKGYIFLMDAIFAVILLVVGLIIVSANRTEVRTEAPLSITLDNSLGLLASVKVSDICDGCNCSQKYVESLCRKGNVMNGKQSLLDYAGELYSRGKKIEAYELLKNISTEKNIFREKEMFQAEIDINDETIYPVMTANVTKSKERSKNRLSSRKMIFGYFENQTSGKIIYWGPYEVRAQLWEKQ